MIDAAIRALGTALAMGWEILCPLIIGFALSAVVQAAVLRRHMSPTMHRCRREKIASRPVRTTAQAISSKLSSCPRFLNFHNGLGGSQL
jgi:hypothetical protein